MDHALGDRHVGDLDAILVLVQPHVVADADLGQDDADLAGHVLADALDAFQQVAAAAGIGQADQPHADLDFHRIDAQVVFHAGLGRLGGLGLLLRLAGRLGRRAAAGHRHGQADARGADRQERNPRQAGEDQDRKETARHGQGLGTRKQLLHEILAAGRCRCCCG